jgi:hypothetical protein
MTDLEHDCGTEIASCPGTPGLSIRPARQPTAGFSMTGRVHARLGNISDQGSIGNPIIVPGLTGESSGTPFAARSQHRREHRRTSAPVCDGPAIFRSGQRARRLYGGDPIIMNAEQAI